MTNYCKLFGSILTSSVWVESMEARLVWITMLAIKDADGIVRASLPGLANIARVSLEKTEEAVSRFESPDEYSRSQENEGRRVKKVDGGWMVLNHEKYRDMGSTESRREYLRRKQREYRGNLKMAKLGAKLSGIPKEAE